MKVRQIYPIAASVADRKAKAETQREGLKEHGYGTYALADRDGQAAIVCLCCGSTSYNPNDITLRYCGFCHEFHSEWKVMG